MPHTSNDILYTFFILILLAILISSFIVGSCLLAKKINRCCHSSTSSTEDYDSEIYFSSEYDRSLERLFENYVRAGRTGQVSAPKKKKRHRTKSSRRRSSVISTPDLGQGKTSDSDDRGFSQAESSSGGSDDDNDIGEEEE